ncbi:hypothetical protein Pmar_PMAR020047, partial [Perkinsus marinus ATCC 50983]
MKKDGNEKEFKRCAEDMLSELGDGILAVFSDGSKADGRVGCGYRCVLDGEVLCEKAVPLSPYGSIYYAELPGVFYAIRWLLSMAGRLVSNGICFRVDNQSVAYALGGGFNTRDPTVTTVVAEAEELKGQLGVGLFPKWIPSHCGLVHNDAVDALATQVTMDDQVGGRTLVINDDLPIPLSDIISTTKVVLKDRHQIVPERAAYL